MDELSPIYVKSDGRRRGSTPPPEKIPVLDQFANAVLDLRPVNRSIRNMVNRLFETASNDTAQNETYGLLQDFSGGGLKGLNAAGKIIMRHLGL